MASRSTRDRRIAQRHPDFFFFFPPPVGAAAAGAACFAWEFVMMACCRRKALRCPCPFCAACVLLLAEPPCGAWDLVAMIAATWPAEILRTRCTTIAGGAASAPTASCAAAGRIEGPSPSAVMPILPAAAPSRAARCCLTSRPAIMRATCCGIGIWSPALRVATSSITRLATAFGIFRDLTTWFRRRAALVTDRVVAAWACARYCGMAAARQWRDRGMADPTLLMIGSAATC